MVVVVTKGVECVGHNGNTFQATYVHRRAQYITWYLIDALICSKRFV